MSGSNFQNLSRRLITYFFPKIDRNLDFLKSQKSAGLAKVSSQGTPLPWAAEIVFVRRIIIYFSRAYPYILITALN